MHRKVLIGVLAAASVATVTACSSSGHPAKTPSTSASTSANNFPSSSTAAATPTPSDTVGASDLAKALLTPTDIGVTGATSAPSSLVDRPLPCVADNAKSLNQQVPATVRAGVDITDDALQVALSEEIRLYSDVTTANAAFAAAQAGLNCTTGTLRPDTGSGIPAKIQAPADITADLAKDTKLQAGSVTVAKVWQATAAGNDIALIAVQIGRSLVLFSFQSLTGADTSKLPSPFAVIQAGLEKIEAS